MEQLHLQIISPSYTKQLGEQTHLLGFDDVLLAGMLAGESRERTYEKQPPVSQGLRGEAQVEFNFTLLLLHDLTFKEDIQVDVEESNASVFQQMLSTLHNSTQWEWDWSKIRISVFDDFRIVYSGSNSDLSVSEGRKKEWLQLVLESAVCPSEELLSGPATANGLACLSGECENLTTPQYFLKNLPSGDVVPIHSAGKLSAGAKNHFYVLGKWIARAYIIDPRVFAPLPLHNFIYESLVAGKPTECERLVSILGNRRLEDVGPYAWKSCDAVQDCWDADTGKYVQDDCYVPLYRSPDTWKELDIKWGAAAPNGVEPYDSVPYERAREYTEQNCRYLWETGFADPVEEIIKGFREVIPTDKMFWKKLQGASHLKQLVEGSHEVDAESFLARVVWQGPWSEADRQMMEGSWENCISKGRAYQFRRSR
ncbi:unnamed protein product [Durusdinium trenchii]|uniref:HECT domain-containing protein n=1 Tax=Durusdinium trenchii TaxID=1381693 RepID=A0ABP0KQY5_9DINO